MHFVDLWASFWKSKISHLFVILFGNNDNSKMEDPWTQDNTISNILSGKRDSIKNAYKFVIQNYQLIDYHVVFNINHIARNQQQLKRYAFIPYLVKLLSFCNNEFISKGEMQNKILHMQTYLNWSIFHHLCGTILFMTILILNDTKQSQTSLDSNRGTQFFRIWFADTQDFRGF